MWYKSSSGISDSMGINLFDNIFSFAIAMISRIFIRKSIAAGGGFYNKNIFFVIYENYDLFMGDIK